MFRTFLLLYHACIDTSSCPSDLSTEYPLSSCGFCFFPQKKGFVPWYLFSQIPQNKTLFSTYPYSYQKDLLFKNTSEKFSYIALNENQKYNQRKNIRHIPSDCLWQTNALSRIGFLTKPFKSPAVPGSAKQKIHQTA